VAADEAVLNKVPKNLGHKLVVKNRRVCYMEKLSYKAVCTKYKLRIFKTRKDWVFPLSSSCPSFSPFSPLQLVSVEPPTSPQFAETPAPSPQSLV
jgi:hypothetical protein